MQMKKKTLSFVLALVFAGLSVTLALANPYAVDHDTFVDDSDNNYNAVPFLALNSSGAFVCTPSSGALLQMDMARITPDVIGTATLDVVLNSISSSGDVTLELFAATADFDETTAVGPLAGWVGSSLGSTVTVSPSTPPGTVLTFPSTSAFAAYMEAARTGDTAASVVILITTCGSGSSGVNLGTKEDGAAAQFNFWNPTATQLQILDASSGPEFASLIWTAFILSALLILVGAFFYYHRSHQPDL